MCGINLIIDKIKSLNPKIIASMAAKTRHRGPDETKTKVITSSLQSYHLAANRLKITDQSDNSTQPFFSADGKYGLLFNGEIYNFYSLKNQLLDLGIQFTTQSDTEVLFHWLRFQGKEGISKLEGMFAFVFINFEENEVIIARDRFGIKPLYYYHDDNYLIISSEIKPIVETGLFPKVLNEAQINNYLLYKYANPPETLYAHVFALKKGHVMGLENGELRLNRFFEPDTLYDQNNPNVDEVENLLTNSLIQQVNAPVPLGLLLSGGVDSTLLLALAKKEGYSLPTFSIINSERERSFGTDDFKFAQKAAKKYSSDHHEVELDITLLGQLDSFITNLDQPIGDSSYLMTSEICMVASNFMKVLLSGAGADELFGGYNRHLAFYRYLKYQKTINLFSPYVKPIVNFLPTGYQYPYRKQVRLIKKLVASLDVSPHKTFQNFISFQNINVTKNLASQLTEKSPVDWMSWALNHDMDNYLTEDVLTLSDKASMKHGVELRVPYLDEALVKYVRQIESKKLMDKGRKWILREILTKYGGKEFAVRSKEGFGLPLTPWLMHKKATHLWTFMEGDDHIIFKFINKNKLRLLIDQQKRKTDDHGPILWSVLVLANWLQYNFE